MGVHSLSSFAAAVAQERMGRKGIAHPEAREEQEERSGCRDICSRLLSLLTSCSGSTRRADSLTPVPWTPVISRSSPLLSRSSSRFRSSVRFPRLCLSRPLQAVCAIRADSSRQDGEYRRKRGKRGDRVSGAGTCFSLDPCCPASGPDVRCQMVRPVTPGKRRG